MCCNPAKGRVEFADGWLIKCSFIEMKACQLTRTKIQNPKKKIYIYKNLENNMKKIHLKCMKI
jgi:hypothetical protein